MVQNSQDSIRLPLTKTQVETLPTSIDGQMALADWLGQVEHSLPQVRHYIFCPTPSPYAPLRLYLSLPQQCLLCSQKAQEKLVYSHPLPT